MHRTNYTYKIEKNIIFFDTSNSCVVSEKLLVNWSNIFCSLDTLGELLGYEHIPAVAMTHGTGNTRQTLSHAFYF